MKPNSEIATYIWPGINGELRFKTRVIYRNLPNEASLLSITLVPWWQFDASSTNDKHDSSNTELHLKPVRVFLDPFQSLCRATLVLCEVMQYDEEALSFVPASYNTRAFALQAFENGKDLKPWIGIEQEYFLTRVDQQPPSDSLSRTGFYCTLNSSDSYMQEDFQIMQEHLCHCLKAGVAISGTNCEVVPHQYEFQIGHEHIEGIEAADHLYVARFILERIAFLRGVKVSYEPKPFSHVNGSGAHINFSDLQTRSDTTQSNLMQRISRLQTYHSFNLQHFGDNSKRLTGMHETSDPKHFSVGRGTRNTTVRMPTNNYLEYRLPASNMDPYKCTAIMFVEMTSSNPAQQLHRFQ